MPATDHGTKPRIGIVTLNFNDHADTERCLRSLLRLSYEPKEIICVDNGSIGDSWRRLSERVSGVIVIRSDDNLGYGGGINLGFRRALDDECDYLLCFNNDARVEDPLFLERILEPFMKNDRVGVSSPEEFDASGVKSMQKDTRSGKRHGVNVTGAVFMTSRKALESAGMFDESLFLYYEDLDLMFRIYSKGFEIVSAPGAKYMHDRCSSTRHYPEAVMYLETRNRIVVHARHWGVKDFLEEVVWFHMKRLPRFILSYSEQRQIGLLKAYLKGLMDGFSLLPKAKTVGGLPRFDSKKWIRPN